MAKSMKRLALAVETVRTLSGAELDQVAGGAAIGSSALPTLTTVTRKLTMISTATFTAASGTKR